jgi:hypothetical protein
LVPSAGAKLITPEVILAPFTLELPIAPIEIVDGVGIFKVVPDKVAAPVPVVVKVIFVVVEEEAAVPYP